MNITIQSQKLLLVEGEDEKSVFTAFLDTLKITDVQVIVCGGNVQFKTKFPNIVKIPGFDDVMVYAIIQDADTNYNSTFQSIQNLLSVNHQPVPRDAEVFVEKNGKRVGIFIMPSHGSTGMLEDLYLQTLGGTPVLQCIDSCITDFQTKLPVVAKKGEFALSSNIAKARTLGTLMATAGPHNRLGHAAMDGYWDLNHIAMRSIRQFIKEL